MTEPLIIVPNSTIASPHPHHILCPICNKYLKTDERIVKKAVKALSEKYIKHFRLRHPGELGELQQVAGEAMKAIDVILTFSAIGLDEEKNDKEFVEAFVMQVEGASRALMTILDWEDDDEDDIDEEEYDEKVTEVPAVGDDDEDEGEVIELKGEETKDGN